MRWFVRDQDCVECGTHASVSGYVERGRFRGVCQACSAEIEEDGT